MVTGTGHLSDTKTQNPFIPRVSCWECRVFWAILASYVTCWILLPALCLIRVGEVGAKQERKDKVKYGVILPPVTWINRIPKQIGCTLSVSIQISQLQIVFSHSYLHRIWGNFYLFASGKCLEEKTWPWYHFCIPFFDVDSLLCLCLLSAILYCHHHSTELLTLHQAFPPPLPTRVGSTSVGWGGLNWGELSPFKWNGVNRSATAESNCKLQKTRDASCLTASTRSTPIKVRNKGELNSS